ncbi:hypothetical protein GCM10020358_55740 [Amorphoplanes nipponensis]|uniref:aminotransferase class III-fold pyridoxal phosphate-dependent enzyme n=1 Tax=Actinoplanes nipponensis TaxID=135950 RepID=UPI0031EB4877
MQTGWAAARRPLLGYQAHGVQPDADHLRKGIGQTASPWPGSSARAELVNAVPATSFSTFGGNPVSTAAGNAVLDYVLDHDCRPTPAHRHDPAGRLRAAVGSRDRGRDPGRGLMIGIEFVRPGTTEPDPAATLRVFDECRKAACWSARCGLYGNVLRMGRR